MAKAKGYNELKKSMLDDLEARGLVQDVYARMVDDYMDLWETLRKLKADIRKRGVVVEDPKRNMFVENRSVSMSAQVSAQMLRIYKALGFQDMATDASRGYGGDPDDEL